MKIILLKTILLLGLLSFLTCYIHAVDLDDLSGAAGTLQKGTQVFVIKDNKAELRPVSVRRNVGEESIIDRGVQPGEMVVTTGQSRLVPGASVIIKPAGDAAADPAGATNVNAPASAGIKTERGG